MQGQVSLVSNQDNKITLSCQAACQSKVLLQMLEEYDAKKDPVPEIPLPNLDTTTLERVVKYLEYHKDDAEPRTLPDVFTSLSDVFCEYDVALVTDPDDDSIATPKAMRDAAEYLEIPGLDDLAAGKIRTMIVAGKTTEGIMKNLGIVCDWTPEELVKLHNDHKWVQPMDDDDDQQKKKQRGE